MLRPTQTCFDDALDFHAAVPSDKRGRYVVVHGICVRDGVRFAHAWVEMTNSNHVVEGALLGDARVYRAMTRAEFAERYTVERCTRYTFAQWDKLNRIHNHFGPWDPEYRSLCLPR
jgi:hypothetical protein